MKSDSVETIDYEGCIIEVMIDDNASDPRSEWDNMGTMVCFHSRYDFGDKGHGLKSSDFDGWSSLERYLRTVKDAAIVLPMYMLDHSGQTISIDPTPFRACDPQGWDWGQVGFIYISKKKIREEYNVSRLTEKVLKVVEQGLRKEVEIYDDWLRGNVYGYRIDNEDGVSVGSCFGFYGDEGYQDMIKEAKIDIDDYLHDKMKDKNQVEIFEETK